MPECVKLNIIV